jgi:bifunctional UDP-N-acetylglucosamine pyrophosphorylase/glucosamine-1-phosphate N-acetyltransferase
LAERSGARAVILAAGRGTRMVSSQAKVLHPVGGLPIIEHVIRAAREGCQREPLVVTSSELPELEAYLRGRVETVRQKRPIGTGDALLAARSALHGESAVMVLSGDLPLLRGSSVATLLASFAASSAGAVLLTSVAADPAGFGRIVRRVDGRLAEIVEAADDQVREGAVEVNTGAYILQLPEAWDALARLAADTTRGELYLSWVPQVIEGGAETVPLTDPTESMQVNDRVQLAAAEAVMRDRTLHRLMLSGVTVTDPSATWVDCEVEVGSDTVIHPGTVIRGQTTVGSGCVLGPFAELHDCEVGDQCRIGRAHLSGCKLELGVDIGPFNRVRPGSDLGPHSHLGTFTEVVRSTIGAGSQVPHLSYVGDSELGEDVNVGAGSITANWDGEAKHRTVIEAGARLGSDTVLVAPVKVGRKAYTAAGSVVTSDVPEGALAVSRARQRNVEGWVARSRPGSRHVAEVRAEEES